jgi:hypothetical protein
VNRIRRYWTLWRTLPDEERRMRAGRLVERLLRRRPAVRRLNLAPEPPRRGRFSRALRVPPEALAARLRERRPSRGPLFDDLDARASAVATGHPAHVRSVLEATRGILEGRIDLLGSGEHRLVRADGRLDWHRDWKSGLGWPPGVFHTDLEVVRGDGSDVKLPWELSRCQHLLVLGQAYLLAPHAMASADARRLRERCAKTARAQIEDWSRANPRGVGVNWTCTMEVALRAATWLAVLGLLRGAVEFDDAFLQHVVRALWTHGRHIRRHLEIGADGLTSNHYLADVAGLYALACGLPELREAEDWERLARRALEEEIERQVHPDGVDFERSLPYHRFVAEMFLHAALLGRGRGADLPPACLERLALMLEFTATATRGDHSVPQWGDNDDGRWLPLDGYASHEPHDHRHLLVLGGRLLDRDDLVAAGAGASVEALWLLGPHARGASASPAGRSSRAFPHAGYYVMREGDLHCAISCGGVGTRGVGNHSHNDVLSVCVWAAGREWISDPGTGSYTGEPDVRNRLRSTSAHATLQLGDREQNELGDGLDGLFRLHERARPEVTSWRADADGVGLGARHFGFGAEGDRWVHERSIDFSPRSRWWLVRDLLTHEAGDEAAVEPVYLRFPLRPETACEIVEGCPKPLDRLLKAAGAGLPRDGARCRIAVRLAADGASPFWIVLDLPAGSRVRIEDGLYSPRYGVTQPGPVVAAELPAAERLLALSALWSPVSS